MPGNQEIMSVYCTFDQFQTGQMCSVFCNFLIIRYAIRQGAPALQFCRVGTVVSGNGVISVGFSSIRIRKILPCLLPVSDGNDYGLSNGISLNWRDWTELSQ